MVNKGLDSFFESYLKKEPLFIDKKALKSEKPSNLYLYGKTGTGKTLTVKYVMEQMIEVAHKKDIGFGIYYINCKLKRVADTEYRLIAQIGREFGLEIPSTGLPTDEVYRLFMNYIKKSKKLIILILDEIDQLVEKAGDEILYNLTRLSTELKDSDISLIGISNDLKFTDNLDPRVRSSLSEEEIVFPPYNAIQLQDILRQRSKSAFRDG